MYCWKILKVGKLIFFCVFFKFSITDNMPVFMITQDPLNMTHSKEIMEIGFVKDWQ